MHAAAMLGAAVLMVSCGSPPPTKPAEKSSSVPATPPPPVAHAPNGITIAAVGDIMMGTDYPENILPDDDGVGFLAGVAPILSAADITFGNLEGVLMDGGEAVKRCKPPVTKNATRKKEPPSPAARVPASAPTAEETAATQPTVPDAATTDAGLPQAATSPATTAEPSGAQQQQGADGALVEAAQPPDQSAQSSDSPRDDSSTAEQSVSPEAPAALEPVATTVSRLPEVAAPAPAGSCFVFRSPTRYAAYLRDAGFDVISLANNHAQDFGDPGRDSSMRTLDGVGIKHSGREGDIAEWTSLGRRFALVAFAPNVGSHQLNELERARQIVTELAAHHDIVIVSFHGGGEGEGASKLPFAHEIYAGEDRGDVVEFAHSVIDAGADLVLGHGPHVLRPLELYRDRLIAYSLGNFATYYGISVNGIRGIAAVLIARVDDSGRFLDGRIEPTMQIRPAGPTLDPARRAITQLRDLSNEAFPDGRLVIAEDGRIEPRR
jgi:capsule synthesis protein PGA_cap